MGEPNVLISVWGLLDPHDWLAIEVTCGLCGRLVSERTLRVDDDHPPEFFGALDVSRYQQHVEQQCPALVGPQP